MAQGYLKVEGREDMELIGEECFENLATRSFFQDFERSEYDGSIISCKIHDIVHDFAQFLAQPMCNETKLRSLSIVHKSNSSTIFPGIRDSVTDIALPSLFDRLTCLRTLCLRCHERHFCLSIARLPRNIKKLKHLRYLNLSNNDAIYELPEALCDLCNLQSLDVGNCGNLHALPQGIAKLINLRHLINEGTPLLYLPKGLERLTCLRTLSEFTVSDIENVSKAGCLQCLQNLNHLQGSLVLTTLGNVTDVGEAKSAKMESKKHLVCLRLEFIKLGRVELVDKDNEVLEALQPSPDLEKLTICDYKSKIISPSWLMSLTELRMLNLQRCGKCEQLPSLGRLPSLESLVVEALSSVRRVGNEFLGIESDDISLSSSLVVFPKLKFLEFRDMDEWEEWDYVISGQKDIKIMPRLHRLQLDGCHKLKALPDHLLLTTKMNELTMNWCSVLKERYGRTGDWRYKVSHIPNIRD
ncbi:hypothetical protein AB3S75_004002 [Citrus x aurantiifolia]